VKELLAVQREVVDRIGIQPRNEGREIVTPHTVSVAWLRGRRRCPGLPTWDVYRRRRSRRPRLTLAETRQAVTASR